MDDGEKFDINQAIESYHGTDFEEFCCHVRDEIDKFIPMNNPDRWKWNMLAVEKVIYAYHEKGIESPIHMLAIVSTVFK